MRQKDNFNMVMPLHEVPVAGTTLLYVQYSFCCKVKVELAKEMCNHFVEPAN